MNRKFVYSNDDPRYKIKQFLRHKYEIIWDNDIDGCFMVTHKGIKKHYFNRMIYKVNEDCFADDSYTLDDKDIICRDILPCHTKYNSKFKSETKIPLYDSIILRCFNWNDKWIFATSKRINAYNVVYKTNKNDDLEYKNTSIMHLFQDVNLSVDNPLKLEELDPEYTYFIAIRHKDIYMVNFVTEYSLVKFLKIHNVKNESIIEKSTANTDITGYIHLNKKNGMIEYKKEYEDRKNLIRNINNVRYLFLEYLSKRDLFKKYFPFWLKHYDAFIKNEVPSIERKVLSIYSTLYDLYSDHKKVKTMLRQLHYMRVSKNRSQLSKDEITIRYKKKYGKYMTIITALRAHNLHTDDRITMDFINKYIRCVAKPHELAPLFDDMDLW